MIYMDNQNTDPWAAIPLLFHKSQNVAFTFLNLQKTLEFLPRRLS